MRKAIVGISAGLILTTLVIAVIPAFAVPTPTTYFFVDWNAVVWLEVKFTPGQPVTFILVPFSTIDLCHGVGGTIIGGYLTLYGRCVQFPPPYPFKDVNAGKGALIGGGKLTGPVVVILTVAGKPPMVYKYYMMPSTLLTFRVSG